MAISLKNFVTYTGNEEGVIAENSADTSTSDIFVTISGGFAAPAAAGEKIAGVSLTRAAFAANNQTVAKRKLNFIPSEVDLTYMVTVSGGTITAADVGKYFNLSSSTVVDGTTEATAEATVTNDGVGTDAVVKMQLVMVGFVSATLCEFKIVR